MSTTYPPNEDYVSLNARLNMLGSDGLIQFGADKAAARKFFLDHVNESMRFFHDLRERIDFLIDGRYYDADTFAAYDWSFVEALHKRAYDKRFRFETFFGAYKFYKSYALREKTGKKRYLERYEDRVTTTALHLAQGSESLAESIMDEIMALRFQPATPTFQNSGRVGGGALVSCFLLTMQDSMEAIAKAWQNAAFLSKRGGGVAFNLTDVRCAGDPLAGIEGLAKGVLPWAKTLETVFGGVDQLGQRPGAGAVYINVHHPDIITILDSKRDNASAETILSTLSIGVVIPDITMELAITNDWLYTFSPYDIEKFYGVPFSEVSVTENYQDMLDNPEIKKFKRGKVRDLFARIAEIQFESGYPYILFEDAANDTNPIAGRVTMSNLCVTADTEIATDNGYQRVGDLYATQDDFSVVVDKRARDMNLTTPGVAIEASTRMQRTAEAADVYRLTTAEGFTLRATEWHKMYVERDGDLIKIPLADVEPGDKVLVQSGEGRFGSHDNADLAYLAGVIAADGTYANNVGSSGNVNPTVRIDLYGDKDEFAPRIEAAAAKVLAGRHDLVERQSTLTPTFRERDQHERTSMPSAPLSKVLAEHGFTAATKTTVPEFVRRGTRATQVAYLDGIFALDGTVTGGKQSGSVSIELGSIEHDLLVDVQRMLLNLGIYTRIYAGRKTAGTAMLPDGRGGLKEYNQQPIWSLRALARPERQALYDLVNWRAEHRTRWEALHVGRTKWTAGFHKHRATVTAIEFDGVEDVYDVTVDNGHSVIFNGVVTGQCSEILQTSTPSTFNDDGSYETVGQDISCNLASLNIANVMSGPDFGKTIETGVRALTAVARMTDMTSVPTVKAGNDAGHSIGLGQMNLHGYLASQGIHYGDPTSNKGHASPEALDFTSAYFAAVAWHAINTSNMIAVELGETFEDFDKSTYADGSYFDKYVTRDWLPTTDRVKALFADAGITLPTREDWAALRERVMATGLYNRYLQAVPPTGSISYINNSTSSIHPITSQIEIREEGQVGRRYYPAFGLTNDNREFYRDAYQYGPYAVIDVYAAAQEHVDQGLSLSLFFTDQDTTADINMAQRYAWAVGIKTVYYIRVRTSALAGTDVAGCVSCEL